MKKYLIPSLVLLMSACAAPIPITAEQEKEAEDRITRETLAKDEAMKPIKCADKAQCDLYWQRVQVWIASNSSWRIRTATDVIIQTYGPGNSETKLAYSSMRENNADGSGTISTNAGCDNIFGCEQFPWSAIADLKAYVTK